MVSREPSGGRTGDDEDQHAGERPGGGQLSGLRRGAGGDGPKQPSESARVRRRPSTSVRMMECAPPGGLQETRSVWRGLASNRRSAVSVTRMTAAAPKRKTVSARPNRSSARDRDATCRIWKWQPSAGSIGSTTVDGLDPSETSHQPRQKGTSMHSATCRICSRRMKPQASGRPGAIQYLGWRSIWG